MPAAPKSNPQISPPRTGKRPRILHAVADGPWGATRLAETLAMAQAQRGQFDVALTLRSLRPAPAGRSALLRAAGCEELYVPGNPKFWLVWRLRQLFQTWKPDVIFAHGYTLHLWARYAALMAGVPGIVQVEHNCEKYSIHRLWQTRRLLHRTDRVVCVSGSVRDHLLRLRHPADRLSVIPNGVNLARFPASDSAWGQRDLALAMVARFDAQKDQATAIRALALLREQNLRPELHFAGADTSAQAEDCRRLAQQLGVDSQVRFLGQVADVPTLLGRTRILVHATHFEGLPLAIIEGLAAGCAVIGSAVPGVPDVIRPNENGLLFPESDAPALAAGLARLLSHPDEAAALGRRGRADAETHFSLERMVDAYDELTREVCAKMRQPPLPGSPA